MSVVEPWERLTWTLCWDLRLHDGRFVFLECLRKILRRGGVRHGGMLFVLGGGVPLKFQTSMAVEHTVS